MESETRIEQFQIKWTDGKVRLFFDDQYIEMSEKCARTLATALATAADGATITKDKSVEMRMDIPE